MITLGIILNAVSFFALQHALLLFHDAHDREEILDFYNDREYWIAIGLIPVINTLFAIGVYLLVVYTKQK